MGINVKARVRRIVSELLEAVPPPPHGVGAQMILRRYFQEYGRSLGYDGGLGPRAAVLGEGFLLLLLKGCAEFLVDEDCPAAGDDRVRVTWTAHEKLVRLVRLLYAQQQVEQPGAKGVRLLTVAWKFEQVYGEGFRRCLEREQVDTGHRHDQPRVRGGDMDVLALFLRTCSDIALEGNDLSDATCRPRNAGTAAWLAQYLGKLRADAKTNPDTPPDPAILWSDMQIRFPAGTPFRGRVSWVARDYAVLESEEGIVGSLSLGEVLGHPMADARMGALLGRGSVVDTVVLGVSPESRRIILSQRRSPQGIAAWEATAARYPAGQRVTVEVIRVTPTGAFVELDEGVGGFLPDEELSWHDRTAAAEKMFTAGQIIPAVVLADDPIHQLIRVGMRQLGPDPWEKLIAQYPVGTRLRLPVAEATWQGVRFELEVPLDGFLPPDEITWTAPMANVRKLFAAGDVVDVVVIGYDHPHRRVLLSAKRLADDPWHTAAERFPPGTEVQGVVQTAAGYGVFVTLAPGVNGLVHYSQIPGAVRESPLGDYYEKGQPLHVRVLTVDPATKRMNLALAGADASGLTNRPMLPSAIARRKKQEEKRARRAARQQAAKTPQPPAPNR